FPWDMYFRHVLVILFDEGLSSVRGPSPGILRKWLGLDCCAVGFGDRRIFHLFPPLWPRIHHVACATAAPKPLQGRSSSRRSGRSRSFSSETRREGDNFLPA